MSMLRDERNKVSSGRALLWLWSLVSLYMVVTHHATLDNVTYAFLSTIEMALIGWNAGPRIAQYIFPNLGASAKVLAEAKSRFPARDHAMGIQPTVDHDDDAR
jgi:hypothetical protein